MIKYAKKDAARTARDIDALQANLKVLKEQHAMVAEAAIAAESLLQSSDATDYPVSHIDRLGDICDSHEGMNEAIWCALDEIRDAVQMQKIIVRSVARQIKACKRSKK